LGLLSKFRNEEEKNKELADRLAKPDLEAIERIPIPFDLVEKIFELYCLDHTFSGIARELNVSVMTVSKYVNHGDPSRDVPPLKARKAEVYAQAMRDKNGEMVLKLRQIMNVAAEVVESTGKRFAARVNAAKELEDPSVYTGDQAIRTATEAKAFNPDSEDLLRVFKAATEVLNAGGKMFQQESGPSISVNATSQANSQAVSLGPAEVILEHFNEVRESQEDSLNVNAVADIVKKLSLKSEEE